MISGDVSLTLHYGHITKEETSYTLLPREGGLGTDSEADSVVVSEFTNPCKLQADCQSDKRKILGVFGDSKAKSSTRSSIPGPGEGDIHSSEHFPHNSESR